MSEDRSLDDFAPGAEREATDPDGPSDAPTEVDSDDRSDGEAPVNVADAAEGGNDPGDDADSVDPATPTSTWHADGADCERCGERVERRWRDGDALVCADCAPW